MRVSYNSYKSIIELSSQLSKITDLYENRNFMFSSVVKEWLLKVEQTYNHNALPGVTEFSTARLQITAAERGVLKQGEYTYRSRRKYVEYVTIQEITRTATSLESLASILDEGFSISKTVIRKLLIDAISSGKINGKPTDYSDAMETWQKLLADPKTSSLAVEVLEKVSYSDAAILMIEVFRDLANEQREIVHNSIHREKASID